tara:strand:- start:78 stop:218 length:141 start_codon:yes stop_codon:yes gene_type:complete
MIKLIILSAFLHTAEIHALPADNTKVEARRRGKQQRGRKRGGNGLR